MLLDFSPTEAVNRGGFGLDRDLIEPIGPDNLLAVYDLRAGVMGLRFQCDADAFERAKFLLAAPESAAYRILLCPKDDAQIPLYGNCIPDKPYLTTDWNLFVPASDRFDYSDDALKHVNVSVLSQTRMSYHVNCIYHQFAGNIDYVNAAVQEARAIFLHDAFAQATALVDSGLLVVLPSDSPAEMELLGETKEDEGGNEA